MIVMREQLNVKKGRLFRLRSEFTVDRIELLNRADCHPERGRTPESKDPEGASRLNTAKQSVCFHCEDLWYRGAGERRGSSTRAFALAQNDTYFAFDTGSQDR